MTKIIAEAGSCHDGEKKKALDLIEIASKAGADAIKFQLLTQKEIDAGNIELPWKWLPELIEHGNKFKIEVFASVFNIDGIKWLSVCKCQSIKFAYSQQHLHQALLSDVTDFGTLVSDFHKVYVSSNVMQGAKGSRSLYCIPEYPVKYQIDFEGIFDRFDGFSSHTLGIEQDKRAIDMGAKYIEKHFKGDWVSDCPDAKFAISPKKLKELCSYKKEVKSEKVFSPNV